MLSTKLKRDLASIYFSLQFFRYYFTRQWASCFAEAAKIELLESHISYAVSSFLFSLMKNKIEPTTVNGKDPYVRHISERFGDPGTGRKFMENDLLFIKPYISPVEKGVLMVKYSEIINAIPFVFDLHKLQQRYHMVLEQSSESPFQPFNAFVPVDSLVFIQSVSERERVVHRAHGFIPVPLTSGDWVNKNNFRLDTTLPHKYDFCIVSNFIPLKRYPFLFAALKRYWKGDLKFAIVASAHVGENRQWMENLLDQYGLRSNADIFQQIPPAEVNKIINQSYCHVLCSLREGAPKVPFEGMIAGTPTVIYKHHIGFPNWKFSPPLVFNYTNAEELVAAIRQCATVSKEDVAARAAGMIGSERATDVLNEIIKEHAIKRGEQWTMDILEKVNDVHTFYKRSEDIEKCIADYDYLQSCAAPPNQYSAESARQIIRR